MKPPKYKATATSTADSELVGWPDWAVVVLVMMTRRMDRALACRSAKVGVAPATLPSFCAKRPATVRGEALSLVGFYGYERGMESARRSVRKSSGKEGSKRKIRSKITIM